MKSIVKPEPPKEYPWLGVVPDTGLVVLFYRSAEGIVVYPDKTYSVGYYAEHWAESDFTPFTGTIELSND